MPRAVDRATVAADTSTRTWQKKPRATLRKPAASPRTIPRSVRVDIFKDTQTYVRFIAFVLLVPVFLASASILLIKELRPIKQVEFKEGGTILFLQDKQPGWAYV